MSEPPLQAHPGTAELVQRATALESRGAWAEAVGTWSKAVARDPSFLPAQLGLAQALIRAGRPADALPILEHVTARAPGVAGAWLALGVAQSMLERHGDAIASAERAVSFAPQVAALHTGLGDVLRQAGRLEAAIAAYRRAAAITPDDPDTLNKLSVAERALGKANDAEALLRRALARAPGHPYANVNLGTLMLEGRRYAEGRALLEAALSSKGLPADAREEASGALAMCDEHAALAGPLAAAIACGDPAPLDEALRARPVAAGRDESLVSAFAALAERLAGEPPIDDRFPAGRPASRSWPALEAHHNLRPENATADLERSVAIVEGREPPQGEGDLDLVGYASAVASRDADRWPLHDGTAWQAWLRWRHAQIAGHRPALWPGHFKLINNLVGNAPQIPRTPPRRLPATLAAVVGELAPRVPAGSWRAIFLYAAIGEMHPFQDANGRVARFLLNRLLVEAGRFPHLRRDKSDSELISRMRTTGDAAPLVDHLASGSHYAAALDREWAAHECR